MWKPDFSALSGSVMVMPVSWAMSHALLLRKKRLWFQREGSWWRSQRRRGSVREGSGRRLPEEVAWRRNTGSEARSAASEVARVSETSMARPRAEPS